MKSPKPSPTIEPIQDSVALDTSRFVRQSCSVRSIRPTAKIVDEPVFLWVAMDVRYEAGKVAVAIHENTAEGFSNRLPLRWYALLKAFVYVLKRMAKAWLASKDRQSSGGQDWQSSEDCQSLIRTRK